MPDEENAETAVEDGGDKAAADTKGGDKGEEEGDLSTIINVDDFADTGPEKDEKPDKPDKKDGDKKPDAKTAPKVKPAEMSPEMK
jgi:hypothetical protein